MRGVRGIQRIYLVLWIAWDALVVLRTLFFFAWVWWGERQGTVTPGIEYPPRSTAVKVLSVIEAHVILLFVLPGLGYLLVTFLAKKVLPWISEGFRQENG